MKKKSGPKIDGVEEIRAQLPRLAAASGAPPPGDGRSLPSIAINQTTHGLAREVAQCQRGTPLFRRGEDLVTVNEVTGEVLLMTPDRYVDWHTPFFAFHIGDGEKRRAVDASPVQVRRILASDTLRAHVPELRQVNLLRLPVWRSEGSTRALDLQPEGYDPATKTFTVPLLNYALDWRLEDAHSWFDATFGDFPFFESGALFNRRSFAALLAAMLGVYTVNLLPPFAVRPMVAVIGNQPGIGKSILVRVMLSPVHGCIAEGSKPKSDDEMRKVLDAAALAGKSYLFLDDLHSLASNDLNHFITSSTHEARVMGKGVLTSCDNVWQVFGTGNGLNITEDLDRRMLTIDLFDPGKAGDRVVREPMTNTRVFSDEYRAKACAAMWAMLRHWQDAGRQICTEARKPSFEDYAEIVGSVIVAAGFSNPFAPRECTMGGDEAGRALESALCRMVATLDEGDELTPGEILAHLTETNALDVVLPHDCRDERKALGHKLKKLRGRAFTDAKGRRFEFGRREGSAGALYTVQFLKAESD